MFGSFQEICFKFQNIVCQVKVSFFEKNWIENVFWNIILLTWEYSVKNNSLHCFLKSLLLLRKEKKGSHTLPLSFSICSVETLHKLDREKETVFELGEYEALTEWRHLHCGWYLKCTGQLAGQREPDSSWERVHWPDLPSQHASRD